VARKEDACVAREACVACEAFLANHSSDACVAKHVACVSDVLDWAGLSSGKAWSNTRVVSWF
jgi:hypothetical protein